MTDSTPLDAAHAAMQAAPEDDAARLRFYDRLGDAELFLMLTEEASGADLSPEIFPLAEGAVVLAFDREDRLAEFAGAPVPYAALSGRVLAGLLAGQGLGLGLNLDVAPSSTLLPAAAVAWLAETLDRQPDEIETRLAGIAAPADVPQPLLAALDAKLAAAGGLAQAAWLVATTNHDGGRGHLLGFVCAPPGARAPLAKAVGEALTFSGLEAGMLDVAFCDPGDRLDARLARVGLRIDLPAPPVSAAAPPDAPRPGPGRDPSKPPILR